MASVSQAFLVVGGVLVLGGALTVGFGVHEQQTTHCDPGSDFVISQLQPDETVDARPRNFENLSTTHQAALHEQLPVDGSERIEEHVLINGTLSTVVEYDGERYYIHRVEVDDCPPIGRSHQVGGGVTTAVGAVIVLSVLVRRERH